MTVSADYAVAFLRLQMRNPSLRLSLRLRDDKAAVDVNQAIAYIQLRFEREKPATSWWGYARQILTDQASGA